MRISRFSMGYVLVMILLSFTLIACTVGGGDDDSDSGNGSVATSVPNTTTTVLHAGEIDDNASFTAYLDYARAAARPLWADTRYVDVSSRYAVYVQDADGMPVPGVDVQLVVDGDVISQSKTDAYGEALVFPSAWQAVQQSQQTLAVRVQYADEAYKTPLDGNTSQSLLFSLEQSVRVADRKLDVLFLLDATGSMADEIQQLQDNLQRISAEIDALPFQVDTRFALVNYRDRGDQYVTQTTPFTHDVTAFQQALNNVSARGGGDYPESLNEALHTALHDVQWRGNDTSKLIFLVADAPPHVDYANDSDYSSNMFAAAWNGIKIHSLASSGLRPSGEFVFRQLSLVTQGHFLFLTYDDSRNPGTSRRDLAAAEGGNFSVSALDDLILNLVTEELLAPDAPQAVPPTAFAQSQPTIVMNAVAPPQQFDLVRPYAAQVSGQPSYVYGDDGRTREFNLWPILIVVMVSLTLFALAYIIRAAGSSRFARKRHDFIIPTEAMLNYAREHDGAMPHHLHS